VKARPGLTFAPDDVASALLRAIRSPRRTAHVHATMAPASFTNADARKLRIRHPISVFTVHLRRGMHADRLMAAAVQLDGTVLKPGDSLSLRGALGEAVPGQGAGTALATGVFNAAWLGGLRLGSHATLPSYGGSYPMGRDASLRDGQDLTFLDDTPYGVLVSIVVGRPTSSHGGSLTATLWSEHRWTVTSSHSDPVNVVPAGLTVGHGARCHSRPGRDGFDVTVSRSFAPYGAGTVDHTGSYHVHYSPVAAVVCRSRHHHHHHH
jgi:vancomycin resistance protein YoaR